MASTPNTQPRMAGMALIGTDPSGEKMILLGRRAVGRGMDDEGTWTIPGGSIDEGERVREAAFRELLEETGWAADALAPQNPRVATAVRNDTGDFTTIVADVAGLPKPPHTGDHAWETSEFQWVPLRDLGRMPDLHPHFAKAVKAIQDTAVKPHSFDLNEQGQRVLRGSHFTSSDFERPKIFYHDVLSGDDKEDLVNGDAYGAGFYVAPGQIRESYVRYADIGGALNGSYEWEVEFRLSDKPWGVLDWEEAVDPELAARIEESTGNQLPVSARQSGAGLYRHLQEQMGQEQTNALLLSHDCRGVMADYCYVAFDLNDATRLERKVLKAPPTLDAVVSGIVDKAAADLDAETRKLEAIERNNAVVDGVVATQVNNVGILSEKPRDVLRSLTRALGDSEETRPATEPGADSDFAVDFTYLDMLVNKAAARFEPEEERALLASFVPYMQMAAIPREQLCDQVAEAARQLTEQDRTRADHFGGATTLLDAERCGSFVLNHYVEAVRALTGRMLSADEAVRIAPEIPEIAAQVKIETTSEWNERLQRAGGSSLRQTVEPMFERRGLTPPSRQNREVAYDYSRLVDTRDIEFRALQSWSRSPYARDVEFHSALACAALGSFGRTHAHSTDQVVIPFDTDGAGRFLRDRETFIDRKATADLERDRPLREMRRDEVFETVRRPINDAATAIRRLGDPDTGLRSAFAKTFRDADAAWSAFEGDLRLNGASALDRLHQDPRAYGAPKDLTLTQRLFGRFDLFRGAPTATEQALRTRLASDIKAFAPVAALATAIEGSDWHRGASAKPGAASPRAMDLAWDLATAKPGQSALERTLGLSDATAVARANGLGPIVNRAEFAEAVRLHRQAIDRISQAEERQATVGKAVDGAVQEMFRYGNAQRLGLIAPDAHVAHALKAALHAVATQPKSLKAMVADLLEGAGWNREGLAGRVAAAVDARIGAAAEPRLAERSARTRLDDRDVAADRPPELTSPDVAGTRTPIHEMPWRKDDTIQSRPVVSKDGYEIHRTEIDGEMKVYRDPDEGPAIVCIADESRSVYTVKDERGNIDRLSAAEWKAMKAEMEGHQMELA